MRTLHSFVLILVIGINRCYCAEEENLPAALAAAHGESIVLVEHWESQPSKKRRAQSIGCFVAAKEAGKTWIISSLTNCGKSDFYQVALGRVMVSAELVLWEAEVNLALLQIPHPTAISPLTMGGESPAAQDGGLAIYHLDSSAVGGAPAIMGRFAGREPRIANGPTFLRLHLPILAPMPGAPIFDSKKKLIGLLVEQMAQQRAEVFHAIPAERVAKFLSDVRTHGRPVHVTLGIVFEDTTPAALVLGCRENSAAALARLAPHDLILGLNQRSIGSLQHLIDAAALLVAEREVEITVLRGHQIKVLKITPKFRADISI